MSKRRRMPDIKKVFERRVLCTLCRADMPEAQMKAHDALPSHRKRVASFRLDTAINKVGFGKVCDR